MKFPEHLWVLCIAFLERVRGVSYLPFDSVLLNTELKHVFSWLFKLNLAR